MAVVEVHESKILLVIGTISALFFSFAFCGCLATLIKSGDSSLTGTLMLFAAFVLAGLALMHNYFRRRLVLYAGHITYTPSFGHKREFSYQDIRKIKFSLPSQQFQVISLDGKKLASFEYNMRGSEAALYYFSQKGIQFEQPVPKIKIHRKKAKINNHAENELSFIRSRWQPEQIAREKKAITLLGVCLGTLCAVSLFLPYKWIIGINLFIPLFDWGLYLWMYPKMTIGYRGYSKEDNDIKLRLPFPLISLGFSLLILLVPAYTMNYDMDVFFLSAAYLTVILLIPYGVMLLLKKRREWIGKTMLVAAAVFILSLVLTPPLNRALTFGDYIHDTVLVTDKKSSRSGSSGTHYYLWIDQNGSPRQMNVSKSLYDSSDPGDYVSICTRKGILGFQYEVLHEL